MGIGLGDLVKELRHSELRRRIDASSAMQEGSTSETPVQVDSTDSPVPLQVVPPTPSDSMRTVEQVSSPRPPAAEIDNSRKREEKKEERKKEKEEKKKKEREERKRKEREEMGGEKEKRRKISGETSQPPVRAGAVVPPARAPVASSEPSSGTPSRPSVLEATGSMTVRLPPAAVQLKIIEEEVGRKRNDLLIDSVVDSAVDSCINISEYLKLNHLTGAHLAAAAQKRVEKMKEVFSKKTSELQDRLASSDEVHRRAAAEMQEKHEKGTAELKASHRKAISELGDKLSFSAAEKELLVQEKVALQADLLGHQARIESLEADRARQAEELKFVTSSRDRISRDLATANKKIDSMYSYEAAVARYKETEYADDIRGECADMLFRISMTYKAALKRMFPEVSMDSVLQVVEEEARADDERRDREAAALENEEEIQEAPAPISNPEAAMANPQGTEVGSPTDVQTQREVAPEPRQQ